MKAVAILPARMGSSRFPGKPLARLAGRTMIEHVYQRTRLCGGLAAVYVATCDEDIAGAARAFGAPVIMTAATHERASERIAEAARHLDADVVVLVQGDEPMIVPEMIDEALQPMLQDPHVLCTNLTAPILTADEFEDRNTIKVVLGANGDALYFSREPIPTRQRLAFEELEAWKQVCVIPYRRDFLFRYVELAPTPLEIAESIDMLRLLEHGYPVRMVKTLHRTQSVDTPADLARVEGLMKRDPLLERYTGGQVAAPLR